MHDYFFVISVVVIGAAVLSWLAYLTRQPIILAYLLGGVIVGPYCLKLVDAKAVNFMGDVSHLGITLLLFLAGIELHPRRLQELLQQSVKATLLTCALFFGIAAGLAMVFGYMGREAVIVGLALMFSSTILVLKLLPTVKLHQRRMGAVSIAVLITQDMIAVATLIMLNTAGVTGNTLIWLAFKGILFVVGVLLLEQWVLRRIMMQVQKFNETLLLLTMAWCVAGALVAQWLGLSMEIGAFLAGVSLARSPIHFFLAEGLITFRNFFLVFFFFSLGASLDLPGARTVLLPAIITAAVLLLVKPFAFREIFRYGGEPDSFANEIGIRLGQCSEFALLIAVLAVKSEQISAGASLYIQVTTLFTMLLSSYLVVFYYPTPFGTNAALKQD